MKVLICLMALLLLAPHNANAVDEDLVAPGVLALIGCELLTENGLSGARCSYSEHSTLGHLLMVRASTTQMRGQDVTPVIFGYMGMWDLQSNKKADNFMIYREQPLASAVVVKASDMSNCLKDIQQKGDAAVVKCIEKAMTHHKHPR